MKCCHTTLKQQVPYIWDPDTFSQGDRPSENVIEIEIAPEVSQLQDHSGPGKIISQKHYKNLKFYQKVSHNVLASQSPSQIYFGSFGVYLIETDGNQLSVVARPSLWQQVISCFSFTSTPLYTCQIRQWCIKSLHVWYLVFLRQSSLRMVSGVNQNILSQRIKITSSWTCSTSPSWQMCNYSICQRTMICRIEPRSMSYLIFSVFDNIYRAWRFLKNLDTFRLWLL